MNYTQLFYWLTVADNAKTFFMTFAVIFSIISGAATIGFLFGREVEDLSCPPDGNAERSKKWMWWSYPFMILFWAFWIFTPTKRDALLIVAGGQTMNFLTTDASAKQIPHELSAFVVTELKNMAKEAQVDLNIKSQKEKILEEAKTLSSEELLKRINSDSTFAKIVLKK